MSPENQLDERAWKAYLSYHQDGLVDIVLGAILLFFGLGMATSGILIPFVWLPAILYFPLKNHITVPRLNRIDFNSTGQSRTRTIISLSLLGVGALLAVGVPVILLTQQPGTPLVVWIRSYPSLFFGAEGLLVFITLGLMTRIIHFYFYAGISFMLVLAGQILGLPGFALVTLLGAMIFLIGISLAVRFMREYPLPNRKKQEGK